MYVLQGGRAAQQRFYDHQLDKLRSQGLPLRLSSTNAEEAAITLVELDSPTLRVVPDSERLWISPRTPRTLQVKTDYETIPAGTPSTQATVNAETTLSSGTHSSSSVTPEAEEQGEDEHKNHATDATERQSHVLPPLRSNSPHPVRCRCGVQGDGNLMTDGLNTLECHMCHTYSHFACQRHGRANDLSPEEDFECDACLGLDTGLPPTAKQ